MMDKYLKKVVSSINLDENEAYDCMMQIISGNLSDSKISAFLTALSIKGETVDEITGFVKAMREICVPVSPNINAPLVDTCGTGGDNLKTFNISTISAIIAASCGVVIAKHGNRSITSKCGGADILEALGVKIDADAREVERCIEKSNIGFMFAPNFHPAMKNVMPVRKELGIRTVFNILGPLTSPANADIQLLGVFDPQYVEVMANVLKNLGVKKALVVHGFDEEGNPAMDEISTIGKTKMAILYNDKIEVKEIYPEDFGIKRPNRELIKASSSLDENKEIVLGVLKGNEESEMDIARLDLCLVNAGAILFIAGAAKDFKHGFKIAQKAVKSGKTLEKLNEFIKSSNGSDIVKMSTD